LRCLARQLDDARALTLAPDLGDSFGRLQAEIRSVLSTIDSVLTTLERRPAVEQGAPPERETTRGGAPAVAASANRGATPSDADWPYLAF
jgi:hypothetical protein